MTRLKTKEKWIVIGKDYNSYYFRNWVWTRNFCRFELFQVKLGTRQQGSKLEYICKLSSWENAHKRFVIKVKKDPRIVTKYIQLTTEHGKIMNKFTEKIYSSDLKKVPNRKLIKFYKKFADLQGNMYALGSVLPLLDFGPSAFFTENLRLYLESKLPRKLVGEYFSVLTTPDKESFAKLQELSLLNLLKIAEQRQGLLKLLKKEINQAVLDQIKMQYPFFWRSLKSHTIRFAWIFYVFYGPSYTARDFLKLLQQYLKSNNKALLLIRREQSVKRQLIAKKKKYLKRLKPDKYHGQIINLASEIVWSKPHRKDMQSKSYYHIEKLQSEIGRRLGLTLDQVRAAPLEELKKWLNNGRADVHLLNEIIKLHIVVPINGQARLLYGPPARRFAKNIREVQMKKKSKTIQGTCAYPGRVRGRVAIVNNADEMYKIKKGMVLVSVATTPSIVPAMMKASAIITDEGGLTSHASIVSREFRIPCVVGTGEATRRLKNGDMVIINAAAGAVKKV
ncbi:hypothetical protein KKF61_01665 [Patescibacteria group bacterium]|nr:hypothetical protein [Patescibacteria group bacterium]MBU0964254.1 hypothetical protein [Patescibacteria group bacterium]